MTGRLTDKARIQHILEAIEEVENYILNINQEQFLKSSEKRFATIKQIEIIGEACKNLSDELKLKHPDIAWRSINGFRNISIHEYFGVNFQLVWEIASINLPELKLQFNEILNEY